MKLVRSLGFLIITVLLFSCTTGGSAGMTAVKKVGYPAANIDDYTVDESVWELNWSDEFNDGVFDTNIWDRQVLLSPYNNEMEQYTGSEDTAYEEDGYMIIKAEMTGSKHVKGNYTSARVISNPGGYRGDSGSDGKVVKFGKIVARIQLPQGKGIWPAFWMLGDNISETGGDVNWPSCGEVDILESGYKGNRDGRWGSATVGSAIHYDTTVENKKGSWNYINDTTTIEDGVLGDEFHYYEVEWNEDEMIFRLDNTEYFKADISDPAFDEFKKDFYFIFNVAVGGDLTDYPDSTTEFPQYMYIDWIRHYTHK